jgi:alpha-beta hydrolase superfamily lysophospholipase
MRWLGALRRWLKNLPAEGEAPLPMLVIQGDADRTVDWRYNIKRIEQLFAGVEMKVLAGARHHLANESAEIREQLFRLCDSYM